MCSDISVGSCGLTTLLLFIVSYPLVRSPCHWNVTTYDNLDFMLKLYDGVTFKEDVERHMISLHGDTHAWKHVETDTGIVSVTFSELGEAVLLFYQFDWHLLPNVIHLLCEIFDQIYFRSPFRSKDRVQQR